ncbi:HET domain-containing protein [Xylaria sp. FL0933]|nr:HET domain-containing protein [Xylaria sp. FL0933]
MMHPLVYQTLPIGHVRLFHINQTFLEPLSGTLKTVALDAAPPYFALSYCWESQAHNEPIQVDGMALRISRNLLEALQRLRDVGTENSTLNRDIQAEWVWIDQICINQNDISERSQQVQYIRSIYSGAIRTLVWLGTDFDSCSRAWRLVDQIYNVFKESHPEAKCLADIPFRLYSDASHAISGLPGWDHPLWLDLQRLFQRSWFTRIWVIQEVVLSREDPVILLGEQRYPWDRLGWASSWLRRKGYLRLPHMPSSIQNVDTISNIRRSRKRWRLDALLMATSVKCHATDQRDKVYALLGLADLSFNTAGTHDELLPDYRLSVQEVYIKVANFLLREYQTLSALTRITGVVGDKSREQRNHDIKLLPSWVPNWGDFAVPEREVVKSLSWISFSNDNDAQTLRFPDHYNASNGLPMKLSKSPSPTRIRLGGLLVDTIKHTVSFDDKLNSNKCDHTTPILPIWAAAGPLLLRTTALEWIVSYIKTTTAEQHQLSGNSEEGMLKHGSAYLLDLWTGQLSSELLSIYPGASQQIMATLRTLSAGGDPGLYAALSRNFCFNRTFFVTKSGRMGIGPSGTQSGDSVAVIFGGEVPHVLQRIKSGYVFVGESYVDGLMKGEAILLWKQGELAETIIQLN